MLKHKSTLLIDSNVIPGAALSFLNLTPLCDWSYISPSSNNQDCILDMSHQEDILTKGDVEIDFNYTNYISILNSNIVTLCNDIQTLSSQNASLEISLFSARQQYQSLVNQCDQYASELNTMQYSLNSYQNILAQELPSYVQSVSDTTARSNAIQSVKTRMINEFTHIVLFQNCDFTGKRLELPVGRYSSLTFGAIAIIPPNLKFTTYTASNFQGSSSVIVDCTCIAGNYNSAVIENISI